MRRGKVQILVLILHLVVDSVIGGCTQKLMTYNTGLTLNVPEYEQRRLSVIEALKRSKSHLICLQEVWYAEDLYQIVTGTLKSFPYSYSAIHKSEVHLDINGSPCGVFNYRAYTTLHCVSSRGCLSKSSYAEAIACGETECQFTDNLSQECITCAIQSATTTWNLFSKCLTTSSRMNTGGLLILSKNQLTETKSVIFYPEVKQLIPRGYLQTNVAGVGTVLCTHLTPNLGTEYYEPNLKISHNINSWEEQNKREAEMLISVAREYNAALILGDLNCGPTKRDTSVSGDFEETFNYLLGNNFEAPYVNLVGLCTWCSSNTLIPEYYTKDHIYDHIMVKNHSIKSAKRYYTKNITHHGYPISDHYGVQVTISVNQGILKDDDDDDAGY